MIILEIDYANNFIVPEAMLPLLSQMIRVKEVSKKWVPDAKKPMSLTIVQEEVASADEAVVAELDAANKETNNMREYWMQEREKVQALEARIKELEAPK